MKTGSKTVYCPRCSSPFIGTGTGTTQEKADIRAKAKAMTILEEHIGDSITWGDSHDTSGEFGPED